MTERNIVKANGWYGFIIGSGLVAKEFYDEVCKEVTIKPDTEFKCMVDGEVYRCIGDVKITTGPRLRFIRC